jgi:hypothetical protein
LAFVKAEVEAGREPTFAATMAAIGWKDGPNFMRKVRRHPDFVSALAAAGCEERPGGGRGRPGRFVPTQ